MCPKVLELANTLLVDPFCSAAVLLINILKFLKKWYWTPIPYIFLWHERDGSTIEGIGRFDEPQLQHLGQLLLSFLV